MKKIIVFSIAILFGISVIAQEKPATTSAKKTAAAKKATPPKLKNSLDSVSYALATLYAAGIKAQAGKELNYEVFATVLKDALTGKLDDSSAIFDKATAELLVKQYAQEKAAREKEAATAEGKKFLAENAKKPGVIQTASGLQYKVIEEGTGAKPLPTDKVKVNYTGKFINGEVFESSTYTYTAGTGVIRGWIEGVQLMSVGSKYTLYIPSDLAYGMTGNQGIPPGAVLVFDLELVAINPGE